MGDIIYCNVHVCTERCEALSVAVGVVVYLNISLSMTLIPPVILFILSPFSREFR